MSIPPHEPGIGTRLDGKYELLRVCGRGGMGLLFEGEHVWTGRRVAVKVLHHQGPSGDGQSLSRFLHEARTAAALRHPNVVDILDMGSDGGSPFLVMELLEGESLEALLARRGRLPPAECLALLLPVLGAVATAHDAGIVHRDLKPANIFLSRDAGGAIVPKLVDFGIARGADSGHDGGIEDLVLGTPAYMSPEQARGEAIGPEADVWALGVVVYRCLSGILPFCGDTSAAVLASVLLGRPKALTLIDEALPARLCAAVERAMSLDPKARYEDTRSLARALVLTAAASGIDTKIAGEVVGLSEPLPRLPGASDRPSSPPMGGAGAGSTTVEHRVVSVSRPPADSGAAEMAVESQPSRGHGFRAAPVVIAGALLGMALLLARLFGTDPATTATVRHPVVASAPPAQSSSTPPRIVEGPPPAPPRPATSAAPLNRPGAPGVGRIPRRKAETAPSVLEAPGPSVPKIRTEW
jgi:serine/threonine protein kinase